MPTFDVQLSMYGTVAYRADVEIEAESQKEAEEKAMDMAVNDDGSMFDREFECVDGWEFQVENCEKQ